MALTTAASDVLKNFYLGPIREQLNTATVLLAKLDRDESTQDVYGKNFTVPIHTGRNNSAGIGVAESAALPTAGNQTYGSATIPNKYVYGRIQVSGPMIKATKNAAGAFIKAIESEVKGCVRDMKKAVNRQLHSDSIDALAFYKTGTGTQSGTIDDGNGNAFTHVPTGGVGLSLYDKSASYALLGTANTTVTLGAKAAANYAITTSANIGAGDASGVGFDTQDPWVIAGTLGYQMMGIAGIIHNIDPVMPAGGGARTSLHGLAVASNAFWAAQVLANSGTKRAMSLELLQDPLSEIMVNSDYSESDVKFLLSNVYARDKYIALCQSFRKIVNEMELDGGFSGVEFNGKPWVVDAQCRRNRVYYIVPETMKIFRSSDFDWMDMDGSVLSRVAGYDAYEAVLFHYGDLGCLTRNANGLLDDIID